MKFGVNLPNFGAGMNPEALRDWAVVAEELGYQLILVSDHVALTDDAHRRSPAPFYESLTTLAWLAGQTRTIRLGTGVVIAPHRHPLLLARAAATLDQLSAGRLVLGAGVGWTRIAFDALGVPFERRGRITDETISALRTLWTEENASFAGEFFRFSNVYTGPRPAQHPHPPIWIGGNSPAAIRRAAVLGDAWHPLLPDRNVLRRALSFLAETAQRAGRRVPAFCPRIALDISDRALPEWRPLGAGTHEQIRGDLRELDELGAEYVVMDTDPGDQTRRRTAEEDWKLLELAAGTIIDTHHESVR